MLGGRLCTAQESVRGIPPFDSKEVTKEWLSAALQLPVEYFDEVNSREIIAGGSPLPKSLVEVTYSEDAQAEGGLCASFFCKVGKATSDTLAAAASQAKNADAVQEACFRAHQKEAAFYRFLRATCDPGHYRNSFPVCFHASDQVIVLENPTTDGSFEAVSDWTLSSHAPDTPPSLLLRAMDSLATLHATYWGNSALASGSDEVENLMTWEQLIVARHSRMEMAGNGKKETQLTKAKGTLEKFSASPSIQKLLSDAIELGMTELYRKCHPYPAYGTVCHGDSNPGNLLAEISNGSNEESLRMLLIDFQEPILNGPGMSDVARVVVSAMEPEARRRNWENLVACYCDRLLEKLSCSGVKILPSREELRLTLLASLLVDAAFIILCVPDACLDNPATLLLHDVVERSVAVLVDFEEQFRAVLSS